MVEHEGSTPTPTTTGWRRWARAVLSAAAAGAPVAGWAAVQFDSPLTGQGVEFGFYSAFWGAFAATIGFGLGAWGRAGRSIVVSALTLLAGLTVFWLFVIGAFTT
jgi:hypothetical protein